MFHKRVKSAIRKQTHIEVVSAGPDAQDIAILVRDTLRRENAKRSAQGKPRVSYRIETAAGQ